MAENAVSKPDEKTRIKTNSHKNVVVLASCAVSFLNWGLLQSFGTFLPALLEEYSDSRSQATGIYAVLLAVAHIVGVASGAIVKKWGTDWLVFIGSTMASLGFILSYFATSLVMLYIFLGLIAGVGMSFIFVCAVIVIGRTFSGKRQTALLSIQNVGTGLAGILLPYLFNWCIEEYYLNSTFLLTGALLLHNFACAIIIRYSTQNDIPDTADTNMENKANHVQVTPRSTVFVLFLIGETFAMSNLIGIFIILLDILRFKGLSEIESLHCLVATNIVGTSARFLPLVAKVLFKDPMIALLISTISGLLAVIMLMYVKSFASLLVGCVFVGICDGATISSAAAVIFRIVVPDAQPFCYGLVLTTIGSFAAGMGPMYGGIYDVTDSYNLVLVIAAIIFGACVLLISLCIILYHRLQPDVCDTRL